MKKSQQLLSEAGESLDYLRDEVRNLGLYVAELEMLVEAYCIFVSSAKLSTISDMARRANLLKETEDALGPREAPSLQDTQPEAPGSASPETEALAEAFRRAQVFAKLDMLQDVW